jgi:site-specific recombinase XerD
MSFEVPISDIEENQETVPALIPGSLPLINPHSPIMDVINAFLASAGINKRTARGYRQHLIAGMGAMCIEKLAELEPVHLMNYRAEIMADSRTTSVHSKALIALRSFLEWGAALRGHTIPMDQAKYLLKVPKTVVITPHEILTDKEIARYLAAAKRTGKREFALVIVALGSGLRISELVHLDIKDLWDDPSGFTVHVRQGKGAKDRLVPVRKEVGKAVATYLESTGRRMGDGGPLFQSEDHAMADRDSWRLSTKTASRIIKECAQLADIRKRVTPHALRHTFAAATFMHNKNVLVVSKLLGHAGIATTYRYIDHLMDSDMRNATPAYLVGAKGPRVSVAITKNLAA